VYSRALQPSTAVLVKKVTQTKTTFTNYEDGSIVVEESEIINDYDSVPEDETGLQKLFIGIACCGEGQYGGGHYDCQLTRWLITKSIDHLTTFLNAIENAIVP
jgi:hypothetical protein